MKTKSIRLTPETIKVLDDIKAGRKVDGKGYYKRDMKYDDVVKELLKYKDDSVMLDLLCNMVFSESRNIFRSDFKKVVSTFKTYLLTVQPKLNNKYGYNDLDVCTGVIVAIDDVLKKLQ